VAVPFTPITLVCRQLRYFVADPSHGEAAGVVRNSDDKEIAGRLELLKGGWGEEEGLGVWAWRGERVLCLCCCAHA
jgi:hypothetical protein